MTRFLIVTADDVGLDRGMTEGALRAHRDGIVTACSLVATGAAFDDAVERLRDTPSIEVGVHLTLVEEEPLTVIRCPRKFTTFVPLYLLGLIPLAAIERELRAQVERVVATGLRVTHLNGHQHLHLLPGIFEIVTRIAFDHQIPYVRIVDDAPHGGIGFARRIGIASLSALGRRARRTGLTNDRTVGVGAAGELREVVALLDHVEGVTELVTHPGIGVRGYPRWGYDWEGETTALCDPRLRQELAIRGIELTTPSHAARAVR
ncbi:MAG TPA: ChbG/HpnK family deacetylase [Thermoanaerobaculia bacterium]